MIYSQKEFVDNLDTEAKINYLKTQVESKRGILAHQQEMVKEAELELQLFEDELYKAEFTEEPCNKDYYEIRSGGCQWAITAGHNDEAMCANPNCSNFSRAAKFLKDR